MANKKENEIEKNFKVKTKNLGNNISSASSSNYKFSLLKSKILVILLELIKGKTELKEYVLFAVNIDIDSMVFRQIFCYQNDLFSRYHGKKYRVELFRDQSSKNKEDPS